MAGLLAWPLEGGVLRDGDLGEMSREAGGVELADSGSGDRRELMSIFVRQSKSTVSGHDQRRRVEASRVAG
jgi:hypothetical protein